MLKIQTWTNNSILRKKSQEIKIIEVKKYVNLGNQMIKYIKEPENLWCWLAWPQVWYNKRIIVVSLLKTWEDENYKTIMMINPEILKHSDEKNIDMEGCLSIPWERGKVERWNMIKLKYIDEKWKTNIVIYNDLRSRIVQHEIDHLDGILFTDKLFT